MRALIVGWPSFLSGEATAGDELSMLRVLQALRGAGVDCDVAYSPRFRPNALHLEDDEPARYSHLVFVCGPAHGEQVRYLHARYAHCRRFAVGVSVVDPDDPAVTGFDRVFARDEPGGRAYRDLSAAVGTRAVPVTGVVFAPGQPEYGAARGHDSVHGVLRRWLSGLDCAPVPLDTRLDAFDWQHCATPDAFCSLIRRMDVVVTTRLHGLVLALRHGVPAIAVDPVRGGGKVSAQAAAWDWPALVPAAAAGDAELDRWWRWSTTAEARELAASRAGEERDAPMVDGLLRELAGVAA